MSTGNKSHSHLQALLPFSWVSSQEANMANKILGNSWIRFTIIYVWSHASIQSSVSPHFLLLYALGGLLVVGFSSSTQATGIMWGLWTLVAWYCPLGSSYCNICQQGLMTASATAVVITSHHATSLCGVLCAVAKTGIASLCEAKNYNQDLLRK